MKSPLYMAFFLGRGKSRKREQRYPQVLASLLGGAGAVLPKCQLGRENRPSLRIPIYSIGEPSGSRRDAVFRAAGMEDNANTTGAVGSEGVSSAGSGPSALWRVSIYMPTVSHYQVDASLQDWEANREKGSRSFHRQGKNPTSTVTIEPDRTVPPTGKLWESFDAG